MPGASQSSVAELDATNMSNRRRNKNNFGPETSSGN